MQRNRTCIKSSALDRREDQQKLKTEVQHPQEEMLIAHALLLIQATQNKLKLPHNPEFVRIEHSNVLLQDLEKRKIVPKITS